MGHGLGRDGGQLGFFLKNSSDCHVTLFKVTLATCHVGRSWSTLELPSVCEDFGGCTVPVMVKLVAPPTPRRLAPELGFQKKKVQEQRR